MNMSHSKPTEDNPQAVEMFHRKGGAARSEFPSGAIARAWLNEHPQQLTWADLTIWLRGSHPV
jgi:hypothetical protein